MTRREMLRECRDGAVRNLPRMLGAAGGLWAGLSKLLEQETGPDSEAPACFPAAASAERPTSTPDIAGE